MKHNEGLLGKQELGGDEVYTNDHRPLILTGNLKSGHGEIKEGSVLTSDASGELDVIKASNTLTIAGIATEDIPVGDDQQYISYLAHGTVKSYRLKGVDGEEFTEYGALKVVGIYAI